MYSPHDLLPVEFPLNESPPDDFFYENVIKHLVPDILRIMMNGIPINLNKVKELSKVVTSTLETNKQILSQNKFIQEYLNSLKDEMINEKLAEQKGKFKTYKDFLKPFKKSDIVHRTYLINAYLQEYPEYVQYISDKWTLADVKKLNTIIHSEFLQNIINNKWLKLKAQCDAVMITIAHEKAHIYNKDRLAPVERFKESLNDLTFNPNSSKQKNGLFNMLEVDTLNLTPTGAKKIDRDELNRQLEELKLLEDNTNADIESINIFKEIIDTMITDSNAAIINNNFIPAFTNYTIDSVLYGNFKLFGTLTFRLTSNSPNLLQLPSTGNIFAKSVKQCFTVPEGYVIYAVDLSALEERVIANLSKDENKLNIFLEDLDSHCLNSYYYNPSEIEQELPRGEDEALNDYLHRYKKAVDSNKNLKQFRQDSKPGSFLLNYGGGPKKLATTLGISLKKAEEIWENFHYKLYKGITTFREELVLPKAEQDGRIHLGLGCYLKASDINAEQRTLFNACSQFWSILTLLAINKIHQLIDVEGYQEDIKVICTIYDSIYFIVKKDVNKIKWLNDNIIPLLTTDFLKDQIVKNEAEGEVGLNWYDLHAIPNNSSIDVIEEVLNKLEE